MSVGPGGERFLEHLNVVDEGRDEGRFVGGDPEVGEHAPFEIEEAVALAEAKAVDGNGGRTRRHEIEAAAGRDSRTAGIGRPKCSRPSSQPA